MYKVHKNKKKSGILRTYSWSSKETSKTEIQRIVFKTQHSTGLKSYLNSLFWTIAICCSVRTGEVPNNLVKIRVHEDWIVFCCYFGDLFGLAYSVLALFMTCLEWKWHVVALFWLDTNVSSRWGITQRGSCDR